MTVYVLAWVLLLTAPDLFGRFFGLLLVAMLTGLGLMGMAMGIDTLRSR